VDGRIDRHVGTSWAASTPEPGNQFSCGWQAERGLAVSGLTGTTDAHAQSLFLAVSDETAASSADDIAKPHMEGTRR
jgi:hypothetical protein